MHAGHSLGGGVSGLVAMLLHEMLHGIKTEGASSPGFDHVFKGRVRGVCFAPARVVAPMQATKDDGSLDYNAEKDAFWRTWDYIDSFVYGMYVLMYPT